VGTIGWILFLVGLAAFFLVPYLIVRRRNHGSTNMPVNGRYLTAAEAEAVHMHSLQDFQQQQP
jgi:hypothetical protein